MGDQCCCGCASLPSNNNMVRSRPKHAAKKGWVITSVVPGATKYAINQEKGLRPKSKYPTAPEPKAASMIYQSNLPLVFRRYYKMSRESFWELCSTLDDGVAAASEAMALWKEEQQQKIAMKSSDSGGVVQPAKKTATGNDSKPSLVPHTHRIIPTTTCLLCTTRYFEGSTLWELSQAHEITQAEVREAVWYVVCAINQLEDFKLKYQAEHAKLLTIVSDLSNAIKLPFDGFTTFYLRVFLGSSKKPAPRKKSGG